MTKRRINRVMYGLVVFLRLVTPGMIFVVNPILAIVIVTFFDLIDTEFAAPAGLTVTKYQKIDKAMDIWWYLVAMIWSFYYLKLHSSFLLILLIYRLAGSYLFYAGGSRKKLVYFPNFYENAFFLFVFATYVKGLNFLVIGVNFYYSLFIVFVLKIIQELFLHYYKKSVREDIFKWKRNWVT